MDTAISTISSWAETAMSTVAGIPRLDMVCLVGTWIISFTIGWSIKSFLEKPRG